VLFSTTQTNKDKIINDMKIGFQKLIHDVRWHYQHIRNERVDGVLSRGPPGSSSNGVQFPQISDRKEITLPPLIPEIESLAKSCHAKFLNVLKTVIKGGIYA
jgi:hypothetical protein